MNNQSDNFKAFILRGVKAFGQKASNLATNAQSKLNQMNLEARRREIITEIPNRAMQLWIDGVDLPAELIELLSELTEVDEKLMIIQAKKYTQLNETDAQPEIETESQDQPEIDPTVEDTANSDNPE